MPRLHPLFLVLLSAFLLIFVACDNDDDNNDDPLPSPVPDVNLIEMQVNGDPFRSFQQYALYDSVQQFSELSGRDGDYTLVLRKNGRFSLGNYQLGDDGLTGYIRTPNEGEFPFTSLSLLIEDVAGDSISGTFSGTVQQQGGEVIAVDSGRISKLAVRRQGNTAVSYTDSTNFTMQIDDIDWSAVFSVGAYRDAPNRLVLEATGQNALTGAQSTFSLVMPIAAGETGTYVLDSVPGLGGTYVEEGATYIFDRGRIEITAYENGYVSGSIPELRGEGLSANDYRNFSDGVFKDVPLFE